MKKISSFVMIIILLIQSITMAQIYDGNLEEQIDANYEEWFEGLIRSGEIPSNSVNYLNNIGYVNRELYEELGLFVYGSPSVVVDNDFKIIAKGYYKNDNGDLGEYRYHGFNQGGERFPNNRFPLDATSGTKFEKKVWNYRPWIENSYGNRAYIANYSDKGIPKVNRDIIKQLQDYPTRTGIPEYLKNWVVFENQINEGMPFKLTDVNNVIYTGDPVHSSTLEQGTNFINYVAVSQQPSSVYSGQGVMFHKSAYGEGANGAWYHTMPIKKVTYKLPTNVEASLKVVTQSFDDANETWHIKLLLTGRIVDEHLFVGTEDEIKTSLQTNINREDIVKWEMILDSDGFLPEPMKVDGKKYFPEDTSEDLKSYGTNSAFSYFEVVLTPDQYKSNLNEVGELLLNFIGRVEAELYLQKNETEAQFLTALDTANTDINGKPEFPEVIELPEINQHKKLEFDINAPLEILDKWDFSLSETLNESEGLVSQHVLIDSVRLSDQDQIKFLSGTYKFPEIGRDKIYTYKIMYEHVDGEWYYYQSYVVVYDHHAKVNVTIENYSKVNRRMSVEVDYSATPLFVQKNTTINITGLDLVSEHDIYYGENTSTKKVFLLKDVGSVDIRASVSNEWGVTDYSANLYVGEDLRPDIFAMVWNNYLAREDILDIVSEEASLDGDHVGAMTYTIMYDSNQNGITDEKVFEGIWNGSTNYSPEKLGFYEITWSVKESFGEPTLSQFIDEEDYKTFKVKREFFVENIVPMTKLYTDIEYNFPKLDVVIIMDSHLSDSSIANVKSNAVNIRNEFRLNSMIANVQIWDTKTYSQVTNASKSINTGESYPLDTYDYDESGYSGNLSRINVSNAPVTRDDGSWVNKDVSDSFEDSHDNTVTVYESFTDSGTSKGSQLFESSPAPMTKSVDKDGYKGELPRVGTTKNSEVIKILSMYPSGNVNVLEKTTSWTAHYQAELSKVDSVWESDFKEYDNYTAYYSGPVQKNIKQSFSPSLDVDSNKYIIYLTDHQLTEDTIDDFNTIKNLARDASVYIVIDDLNKIHSIGENKPFLYQTEVMLTLEEIVKDIKVQNPINMEFSVLQDETFSVSYTDSDYESDPLILSDNMFYVHDKDYFDNPTGQEDNTYANYDFGAWTSELKTAFSQVGKYTVYRKIKDNPIGFTDRGLESNLANIEIVVHRKPIANYELKLEYNSIKGYYDTTWLDKSYDLDFEFSDPVNKGIIDRKIKYRRDEGQWLYEIPKNLMPGSYDIEYIVQDNYGVWSDIKKDHLVLNESPDLEQLEGRLKTYSNKFSLNSIPHTEDLIFYDVVTRMSDDHEIYYQWFSGNLAVSEKMKLVGNYTLKGIERHYDDSIIKLDKKMANGDYILKLSAESQNEKVSKRFSVQVKTPIDLVGGIDSVLNIGTQNLKAKTSKYVDEVFVTIMKDTIYEKEISLNKIGSGLWENSYTIDSKVEDGIYNFEFEAIVNSEPLAFEVQLISSELKVLEVDSIKLIGDWSYYAREENIFDIKLAYNEHRFLSLEHLNLTVNTIGKPDKVEVYLPKAFINRYYRDNLNEVYDNTEWVTLMPETFSMAKIAINTFKCSFELPLVASTLDINDQRLKDSYIIKIILTKDNQTTEYLIDDIEVTGNIYDHLYLQPKLE